MTLGVSTDPFTPEISSPKRTEQNTPSSYSVQQSNRYSPKPTEHELPSQSNIPKLSHIPEQSTIRPQVSLPNTPRPTPRPTYSARPSLNGPSAPPTIRPSRLPAASLILEVARRSAAPTSWSIRSSIMPLQNISVLNSAFRFSNANASIIENPEKLQQLTANIACALRVPLENILIKNITQIRIDGTINIIQFDPRIVSLNSNSAVVCYTQISNSTNRLLRGKRRLAGDSSVSIEYSIIDPPTALLSMDPATFASTIESDPAIISIATILGSDGVIAEAPPELTLIVAAAPVNSPNIETSDSNTSVGKFPVGPVVGGILGAFLVGGLIVGAIFMFAVRKPKKASIIIVQNSEPTVMTNPMVKQAERHIFDPVVSRGTLGTVAFRI
jgi:hypothetical protein